MNEITVRVVVNVEVFELLICGLTGSQTPGLGIDIAFDEINLASPPGSFALSVFGTKAFWTQNTGTLVLRQLSGRASPPGAQFEFKFNLLNPVIEQLAPRIDLHVAFPRPPYEAGTLQQACQYQCPYTQGSTERRCPCQVEQYSHLCNLAATFASGPFQVDPPLFVIKRIAQQTTFPGESNTITVTISTNIAVETKLKAKLIIIGLQGTDTPDSTLTITSKPSQIFEPTGNWQKASGKLTIMLSGNVDRFTNYSLAFQIKNSVACGTQCAPATTRISIAAQMGTCQKERESYECPSTQCGSAISISDCTSSIKFSEVLLVAAPGDLAPLRVHPPAFMVKTIAQSSALPGQMNTLTVSVSFNVKLTAPTQVVISGLQGTRQSNIASSNGVILTLSEVSNSGVAALFGSTALFDAVAGTLTLSIVDGRNVIPDRHYVMNILVRNAMTPQDAPQVSIFTSGAEITLSETSMDGQDVLKIIQPEFTEKRSGQSSAYPGAENIITISLTPNTDFPVNAIKITVTGLFGASLPSDSVTLLDNDYPWTGDWDQYRCVLEVLNRNTIAAKSSFRLIFRVINSLAPQPPPVLQVSNTRVPML